MTSILIIGNGAREHVVAWSIVTGESQDDIELYALMSTENPGIAKLAKDTLIAKLSPSDELSSFIKEHSIEIAVVGPEAPLAEGISDFLEAEGVFCFGPRKDLAQLETSKGFTRALLEKYKIQGQPQYRIATTTTEIKDALDEIEEVVVKPDGLTGGKGVKVMGDHLQDLIEAKLYSTELLVSDGKVIIEEKLVGPEFSFMGLVHGGSIYPMPIAHDHKRAFEGDLGPNTGGMGSVSIETHRMPFLNEQDYNDALDIMEKTIVAVRKETGMDYQGVLYGGFMKTKNSIRLIEYNTRFGDPEVMNTLPLLKGGFGRILLKMRDNTLSKSDLVYEKKATVVKYLVPQGYPISSAKDKEITIDYQGLESDGAMCFLASVYGSLDDLHTTGSRSVAVVGVGNNLETAEQISASAAKRIQGPLFYRRDIGTRKLLQSRVELLRKLG